MDRGCLVLRGNRPALLATIVPEDHSGMAETPRAWSKSDAVPASVVQSTRLFREKLLADPYRPGYHFCVPEDNGQCHDFDEGCYVNGCNEGEICVNDQCIDDPTAMRVKLQELEQEYPERIAAVRGDLAELLRRCALAVLNSGEESDDAEALFSRYRDFSLEVEQVNTWYLSLASASPTGPPEHEPRES